MGTICCNGKDSLILGKSDKDFNICQIESPESLKTIYEMIGGEAAIDLAVDKFYDKVVEDPVVKDFFKNTNMKFQRKHQKNFLCFATGGPNNYMGKNMREAHKHMNLTDKHFNQIKLHLADTLKELEVSESLIDKVSNLVESLRQDILCK